jgi:signal transduction histidine kinase/AraC-like DNA-binding protein
VHTKTRLLLTIKLILPAILLTVVTRQAFAQQLIFTNQQHFGVEEGLPQSYITGIIQDEDGFIWLATQDGFSRYDGRGFKTIHYNPKDTAGLAANTITSLGRQVNNNITIYYSPTQADDFNLRTYKVTRNTAREQLNNIPNIQWQTYHISYSSNNWFFMMSDNKGIGWLNYDTRKIHYANKANHLLQYDTVSAIVESTEGRIYLVSENGVQVSDTRKEKFEWIRFATNVKKQSSNIVEGDVFGEKFSIVSLPGNRLAIDDHGKIILLDIDKKRSRTVELPRPPPGAVLGNGSLQVDTKDRVYFENYGRIFRLEDDGELKLLWENQGNGLRISSFFIDRSDVLWVSVNAQGLLKIDLQALHFESYRYGTNFISDILAKAGAQKNLFPKEWKDEEASYYFRQAYDTKGNLYACFSFYHPGKIYKLNEQGFRLSPHSPDYTLYTAILTMPGYAAWTFDHLESAWYCWKTLDAIPEKLLWDKTDLENVEIADAKFLGGFIWLSTYNHGLIQYQGNRQINKFAGRLPQGIMPETLTEICPDPVDTSKFWIGSRGGGLILWDVQKGLQRIYTVADGLPNNTIYCILPDKAGKIWCSSNKGIFRFDVLSGQVTAFEKTDGLSGNEFNRAHKFMFPDGRLAFGGLDGYTIFNPADFDTETKTVAVPVLLTGLQINNQSQDINIANRIIKEPLSTISAINLPYNKNFLRFEFAAMLFNQPQKTKYRYQLKGVDVSWIENGTNNIVSYAGIRPGKYTFRINATDNNGLWSDMVKEITVIVHPPFWFTWWAYLLYAIVAGVLIRSYFIFRERRIKTEQSLAFEKKEALRLREIDELKDRFFSNITHEFRTPLTLIISPLEKLMQDSSLSTVAVSTIKTAHRNSKQLLRLINEFLDFSKLNDGQMKIKLSTGELDQFASDCVQSFQGASSEKNINLSFTTKDIAGIYLFDQEKWEKIIANLLGNALKFTPQNGEISVLLSSCDNDEIRLEVTDNGPGVPEQQQQKIFDRFYQVDDSSIRNYGGTGIGLSLVKELTDLMRGSVELDSKQGGLTRFIVQIPVQKVHDHVSISLEYPVTVEKYLENNGQNAPLVLVVEDNDELRAFLVESMRNNYQVVEAADGLKAWETILQELPDIIISDVMMPGQDGFDLCRICKSDNRTAHIGFILLTSKVAHETRLKGLATGADDYITKPFNLDELQLRISNLLQLQQKQRLYLQSQLIISEPREDLPEVTDPFLVRLYKEMDDKLDDPTLGIDYLCKTMAMSRSTLNRKLKSLLNISANDLIRQYRLQKAASLLSSGLDITTSVYKVGFSSPSYFSQCFKDQYGITPSDYILKRRLTQN